MANDVIVNVKIDGLSQSAAGIKELTSSLNNLMTPAQKAQKNLKQTEESVTSLATNGFKKFAIVAGGAIATFTALFAGREMINAAEEKQNSINALNVTLQSLGIYSKETSQDLQDFADNLEKTTKFSDDQVISTINLIGAMTNLDKDGLKLASKASLDLASTLRIDLDSATRLIAKSVEGNVGALKRYGVEVKQGSNETENLANTMEALSRMAGRSEKDINTFSGAMSFLRNGFDEVLTALGSIIVNDPIISGFIKRIGQGFFALGDAIKEMKLSVTDTLISILETVTEFGIKFQTVIQVIESLVGTVLVAAFVKLTAVIYTFVAGLNIATVSSFALSTALTTLAGVGIVAAVAAVATLIFQLVKIKDEFGGWGNLVDAVSIQIQIAFKKLEGAFQELRGKFFSIIDQVSDKFTGMVNAVREFSGMPPISIGVDNQSMVDASIKTIQLTSEIQTLEGELVKMKEGAKNGQVDFFAQSLVSLNKLKNETKDVARGLAGSGSAGEGTGAGATSTGTASKIEQTKKDFEDLYKSLEGLDKGDLGRLNATYDQRKQKIDDYLKTSGANQIQANEALRLLQVEHNQKIDELNEKQRQDNMKARQEEVAWIKANPLAAAVGIEKVTSEMELVLTPKLEGLIQGFGEAFKNGKQGATDLVTGLVTSGIDTLLPGVGQALSPFIDMFAQGPEATQKMVEELMRTIPEIIVNIVKAVPVFIKTLIREAPKMIKALIDALPDLILGFINEIPNIINELIAALPQIITQFANAMPSIALALAQQAPMIAMNVAWALIREVPNIINNIINGLWNGISRMFNSLVDQVLGMFGGGGGGFLGFAEGGKIVKGGIAGKDSVPAALMPGEVVVDRGLTAQMQEFFDNQGSSQSNDVTNALLTQVIALLSSPQQIRSDVKLNNRTLAEIMINLNRTNSRVTI